MKYIILILFLNIVITPIYSQNIGDYRSISSNNWIQLTTWQRFDGDNWVSPTIEQGYPGQYAGTQHVQIQSGNSVTISNTGISTQNIGKITIHNTGQLNLTGGNSLVTFSFSTMEFIVQSGGSIYLQNKVKIVLPTNAVLYIQQSGLLGDCNNNNQIWIGTVQYAACAGAPGTIFTFAQVMDATSGGTLNAIPSSNSPILIGQTITLFGSYSGAVGTAPTYSWQIINPHGIISANAAQNLSIESAIMGIYTATLTVTTVLNGMPYTNSESISIIVSSLPTLHSIIAETPICAGNTTQVYLSGLIPQTQFSVVYSINENIQPIVNNLNSDISGNSSFTTLPISHTNDAQSIQIHSITITNPGNNSANFTHSATFSTLQTGTWLGLISSDWNTSSNWCGGIPNENTNAIILNNAIQQPTVNSYAHCNTILIQSGSELTINQSGILEIYDHLENNGSLRILSNAIGDGQLITKNSLSGLGNYTIQRYLSENMWHLVSSPTHNAFSEVFLNIWLRPYLESDNSFGEYIVPTTIPLTTCKGFSVWAKMNETRNFTGLIHNGLIGPISLEKNNQGWNLIGNPYPCTIDWLSETGWNKQNVANAIYTWNSSQYATFVNGIGVNGGARYIASGQGFFVQALSSDASISINNAAKTSTTSQFKQNSISPQKLTILVTNHDYSDEIVIYEQEETSKEFNSNFDAEKLYGIYNAPQLYTYKNLQKTSIHSFSDFDSISQTIINLEIGADGQYTLQCNYDSQNLYLFYIKDLLLDSIFIGNVEYTFFASKHDNPERFIIHKIEKVETNETNIVTNIENINQNIFLETSENKAITVYSISGRLLYKTTNFKSIDLKKLPKNLYLLNIHENSKIRTILYQN
ncbi:MAG TPA: T9SS type A sorting domain-containing protein [Bacteroidales bacterium]|nr:T9SS type A sorting domain-containing protein [Bacteroidales bacterium]